MCGREDTRPQRLAALIRGQRGAEQNREIGLVERAQTAHVDAAGLDGAAGREIRVTRQTAQQGTGRANASAAGGATEPT